MKNKKIISAIFLSVIVFSTCFIISCTREKVETDFQNDVAEYAPLFEINEKEYEERQADSVEPEREAETPEETIQSEENIPEEIKEESYITYLTSITDGLNVRKGAGTQYASIGKIDEGDVVMCLGEEGDFFQTYYRGGIAYVSKKYTKKITMEKADESIENVIKEGAMLLGTPYVYGAVRLHDGEGHFYANFDKNKFDCSSLMQYIFYKGKGTLLQVNTRTQVYQGVNVEKENLKRGDLLFFTNASRLNKTGIERIGHVGLYLGDGYMLHTASDYAVIEKISSLRWSYFICARRV